MEMMRKKGPAARVSVLTVLLAAACLLGCGIAGSTASSSPSDERPEQAEQDAWIPEPRGWVTDLAGVLPVEQADRIARMLAAHERETSREFALLTVEDLRGEAIESFSMRVANAWRVGKADASNGLLVVLAIQERKIRIEVADGLSGLIPDDLAQKILDRDMTPAFRDGRFAAGVEAGFRSLMDAASK